MQAIYLDHAATTPMKPEVVDEMMRIMTNIYGNPSSIHQFGRQAEFELENARELIAKSIQATPQEIVFNSGGTEGDNTAIIQTALNQKELGRHIISTEIEHSAVLNSLKYLETQGFEVTYLPVNHEGRISIESFEKALRDDTILVSIMYGNNEVGIINPIREIGAILAEHQAVFHTDAVQAFGSEIIDVRDLQVDFLSVSSHKINGPKGVGFVFEKQGTKAPVLIHGGDQEEKKRAGTENVAGIVGMSKAISLLTDEKKEQQREKYQSFKEYIIQQLEVENIAFEINGSLEDSLTTILNIWLKGVPNNLLLSNLDLKGYAISTGSACNAGNVKPSEILKKIRPNELAAASESIRVSFGYGNEMNDIVAFTATLIELINKLKK